jgi:hypothetical protein
MDIDTCAPKLQYHAKREDFLRTIKERPGFGMVRRQVRRATRGDQPGKNREGGTIKHQRGNRAGPGSAQGRGTQRGRKAGRNTCLKNFPFFQEKK